MAELKYLTVTALTKYIRYKFDNDVHLANVLLEGEISNFKHHSRGHFYFTIKDNNAQISATMFYREASKVNFTPQDGMKVLVKGSISVYEPQGTYSINVYEMEQQGIGSLYLAYEKLKNELREEGYFDPLKKLPLPRFPKAIGVITSPTGAAVRDCINTIQRRYPLAHIYVYPTLVQGEEAKFSIVKNIELANKDGRCDVLIVGRGGGSIEDLWAFNERIVAEAIYKSKLPIISAVGHETDTTIADFVADKRAATPTAAAELATPNLEVLKENIKINEKRLNEAITNKLKHVRENLVNLDKRLDLLSPKERLNKLNQKRLELSKLLNLKIESILERKKQALKLYKEKLIILNPLMIMDKGFSIVLKDEKIVKSKNDLVKDDLVTLKFKDGEVMAKVMEEKK